MSHEELPGFVEFVGIILVMLFAMVAFGGLIYLALIVLRYMLPPGEDCPWLEDD